MGAGHRGAPQRQHAAAGRLALQSLQSILIVGAGEDGKFYPMVAMPNVDRWLAADEPEGLSIVLDVLKKGEVGIPG